MLETWFTSHVLLQLTTRFSLQRFDFRVRALLPRIALVTRANDRAAAVQLSNLSDPRFRRLQFELISLMLVAPYVAAVLAAGKNPAASTQHVRTCKQNSIGRKQRIHEIKARHFV